MGDKSKTSVKSCEPEHSEHPERTGRQEETSGRQVQTSVKSCGERIRVLWRQVRNHADQSTQSIQSELGDKWETSGDKPEIIADIPECSGRQMGEKCKIMRTKALRASREKSLKSCGQRMQRAVGDDWETSAKIIENMRTKTLGESRVSCRKTSPETNAKSRGPSMHPFQRSKNPSQVNLHGESHLFWQD